MYSSLYVLLLPVILALIASFVQRQPTVFELAFQGDIAETQSLLHNVHSNRSAGGAVTLHDVDTNGNSLLHWASKGNRADMCNFLIEQGVNAHARNKAGTSALHWAMYKGTSELLSKLFDAGISIDSVNDAGETPLHWAVDWQNLDGVTALVERGANVNMHDTYGNIPLHKINGSCDQDQTCRDIVAMLVKSGSDVTKMNHFGRKALDHFDTAKPYETEKNSSESQGEALTLLGKRHFPVNESVRGQDAPSS